MDERVLIVDDEVNIRDSMVEFVERAGYPVFSAGSAEDAVKLLRECPMDIVITDIILPGMDGLGLTDIIKTDYDTDVIVMTGYSGDYSYEEAINKGASDFVFKPVRFEELLLRLRRVTRERTLTKEREKMLGRLQNLAITDGLTKLNNSRHFYTQLAMEVQRSNRYGHPLALLLLDIDNLKKFNDNYGHLEGDRVLVRIAEVIKRCLRTMDSAYRYGGEEFTILLPETNADEALTVAERLRNAVEEEKFSPDSDEDISVTVSVGVTGYRQNEKQSTFVHRADQAMYTSKEKGRNRVSLLNSGKAA
jgi:two-component system cell cycle response regulator